MQIKLDTSADALYIKLKNGKAYKTKAIVGTNSLIDFDKKGEVVGIEVLNYSKSISEKADKRSILIGERRVLLPA